MSIFTKKIGIWGFGVLGQSAVEYLHPRGAHLEVIDSKEYSPEALQLLKEKGITYYQQSDDLVPFLERNEYIVPSSGIDLRPYSAYQHKWITELDFFYAHWQKPIIAITGTVGKTSTTQLLGQLINAHGMQARVGGNIGVGLFDLLQDTQARMAVLELSSFQLEISTTFAPDLAIWTNFFANHLDRHTTLQDYFDAKYNIVVRQREQQKALLPLTLQTIINATHPCKSSVAFFTATQPTAQELTALKSQQKLFYLNHDGVMLLEHNTHRLLLPAQQLPTLSFQENWLIICGALHLLNIPLSLLTTTQATLTLPEHRLEKVATHNSIDFYNDSKSTTMEATLAAVQRLQGRPVHLFLGGMGKGVDRTPLIQQLAGKVAYVYCFGKEAEQLHALCTAHNIASSSRPTLESAFEQCCKQVRPQDQVLLSPAGASFDLFANYVERGKRFKELVATCLHSSCVSSF